MALRSQECDAAAVANEHWGLAIPRFFEDIVELGALKPTGAVPNLECLRCSVERSDIGISTLPASPTHRSD